MHADHDEDGRRGSLQRRRRKQERRGIVRQRALAGGVVAALLIAAVTMAASASWSARRIAADPATGGPPPTGSTRSLASRAEQDAAIQRVLGYTDFLRAGRRRRRQVALTFDDGPGPYTAKIMRILREHDAPATFFVLGGMLESFPDLARKELRDGNAIGSHTVDHAHMGQLGSDAQAAELRRTNQHFRAAGLPVPKLFRPPYGSFDTATLSLLAGEDTLMVLWSVDTGDYLSPGSDAIVQHALGGARPGAVILMHDAGGDRSQTIEALPRILAGLKRRGLEPVTVPELLIDDPPPRNQDIEEATAVRPPGAAAGDGAAAAPGG